MPKNPFSPTKLPVKVDYSEFVTEIAEAHSSVARYDEALHKIPDPSIIQRTLITNEAVLSSKIEGTQATLKEVLEYDAEDAQGEETEKKRDYREIINYRKALTQGEELLNNGDPISENYIKKLHRILLNSVRGHNRNPGEFRRGQVFIGPPGAGIDQARYVPPLPTEIPNLFSNLVNYINSTGEKDTLVQAGIIHYQFEAIHPFSDGNGRVGRILIPIFLFSRGVTSSSNIYISEFFEEHRQEYYDSLNAVSEKDDWKGWITFFLRGVKEQSNSARKKVEEVETLYKKLHSDSSKFNSFYASSFINGLFMLPIFSPLHIKKHTKIKNNQTLYSLVEKFEEAGVIKDISPERERKKVYAFMDLLKIVS